jgi:hypothetical protein
VRLALAPPAGTLAAPLRSAPLLVRVAALPRLASAVPAAILALGGTPLLVHGEGFLPSPRLACAIGEAVVPAAFISPGVVRCAAPTLEAALGGVAAAAAARGAASASAPVFSIALRVLLDSDVGASEGEGDAASPAASPSSSSSSIPLLFVDPPAPTSVEPAEGAVGGGSLVLLRGGAFPSLSALPSSSTSAAISWTCLFGREPSLGIVVNATTLACVVPPLRLPSATLPAAPGARTVPLRVLPGLPSTATLDAEDEAAEAALEAAIAAAGAGSSAAARAGGALAFT